MCKNGKTVCSQWNLFSKEIASTPASGSGSRLGTQKPAMSPFGTMLNYITIEVILCLFDQVDNSHYVDGRVLCIWPFRQT